VIVQANPDGSTWETLDVVSPAYDEDVGGELAWSGDRTAWELYTADLSAYVGESIQIRFAFSSDFSIVGPGAYIDQVAAYPSIDQLPVVIAPLSVPADVEEGGALSLQLSTQSLGAVEWTIETSTNADWLALDPDTGLLSGTATAVDIGPVALTVRASRLADPGIFDEVEIELAVLDVVYAEGFEVCPGGFALTNDWTCGDPTVGPLSAHGGTSCLGTETYADNRAWGSTTATSPAIDLAGLSSPELRFWFWQDVEFGWDCTQVQIRANGGPWVRLDTSLPYDGNEGGQPCWTDAYETWEDVSADLAAYAGQSVEVRWSLFSDSINTDDGPYVDDVRIVVP
jgi:hypothetical protein